MGEKKRDGKQKIEKQNSFIDQDLQFDCVNSVYESSHLHVDIKKYTINFIMF
jgi:hypothetical protein